MKINDKLKIANELDSDQELEVEIEDTYQYQYQGGYTYLTKDEMLKVITHLTNLLEIDNES